MPESLPLFGAQISLYYLFWFLGVVAVLVVGYFTGKKYGFSFAKSVLYIVLAVAIGYALLWGTSLIVGRGKMAGLNYVRIVTFLPIAIWLVTLIFKDKFGKVADFIAPLLAIFHGVTHIGCIFPGCCHGYPMSWGLYSNEVGAVCFPSQPLEACSSLLIAVVLLFMVKKNVQQGKLYAWYLILFGGTRFVWEFLRDNEKIWLGISELAIHALIALIVGLAVLIALNIIYQHKRRRADEKLEN